MARFASIAVLLALLPAPTHAVGLLCLGTDPGFMMVVTDDEASLDYLGDGRFSVDPALPAPLLAYSRHSLTTAGGPLPVFIERRACQVAGIELPFVVELGLPSNGALRPARGCCREATD